MNAIHTPTRMERILNILLDHKVIVNCDRDPYLLRWYLFKTARVSCFIHKFIRSDEDRALHDHPWAFLVIPIWRGYIEYSSWKLREVALHRGLVFESVKGWTVIGEPPNQRGVPPSNEQMVTIKKRIWPLWSTRYRAATYCHRVEIIEDRPSWSIFFHFKRERDWGFHPAEGFTLWNKWWQDKCE